MSKFNYDIDSDLSIAKLGKANGFASLDNNGKLLNDQLPFSKIILSSPISFYVDSVNGIDGSNNGQTTNSAFNTLFYCLTNIKNTYVIDTQINIILLSDIEIEDNIYNLNGFEIGIIEVYPSITITSAYLNTNDLTLNKTITLNNTDLNLVSFSKDLYIKFEYINFNKFNSNTSNLNLNLTNCEKIYFISNIFTNINLNISLSKEIQFISSVSAYSKLINSILVFSNCTNGTIFDTLDLVEDSSISFIACSNLITQQNKNLRISGNRTDLDGSYLSFLGCYNYGYLNNISINTSNLIGPLLIIQGCSNFTFNITPVNTIGGIVYYSAPTVSTNNNGYLVQIYRSNNITITGGSDTKFIDMDGLGSFFMDNRSEIISSGNTSASRITNLCSILTTNLISPDGFYNGLNFRSTTNLVKNLQSEAIDEINNKILTYAGTFVKPSHSSWLSNPTGTNSALIYVDVINGNDNNNGTTSALAIKTNTALNNLLKTFNWNNRPIRILFENADNTTFNLDFSVVTNYKGVVFLNNRTTQIFTGELIVSNVDTYAAPAFKIGASGCMAFYNCNTVGYGSYATGPLFIIDELTIPSLGTFLTCDNVNNVVLDSPITFSTSNINIPSADFFTFFNTKYIYIDLSFLPSSILVNTLIFIYDCIKTIIETNNNNINIIGQVLIAQGFFNINWSNFNTITGSINNSINGEGFINNINYDNYNNAISHLTSTTVQSVIDEVALRNNTRRQTIATTTTLTNDDPSIQNCLNSSGVNQTLILPFSPSLNKYFYILNRSTSNGNLIINGNTIIPGAFYSAIYDGIEWVRLYN